MIIILILIGISIFVVYRGNSITSDTYIMVNDMMNYEQERYLSDIELVNSDAILAYLRRIEKLIELDGVIIKGNEYQLMCEFKWAIWNLVPRQVLDSNKEQYLAKLII